MKQNTYYGILVAMLACGWMGCNDDAKVTTDGVICLKYNDQTRQITGKTVYLAANGQHCTTQARVYIGYSGRRPEVFFVPEEGHAVAVVPYDASFLAPVFS